jgi:hypothetical protein
MVQVTQTTEPKKSSTVDNKKVCSIGVDSRRGSERETKAIIKLMKYVITFMYNLFSFPFH